MSGEFRFRHGYCKSNPRKMVRMWAEKEMRNYRRLGAAGVPCPEALLLKEHVLLMRFIGTDGWAAPRLKDAALKPSERTSAWRQARCLVITPPPGARWRRCYARSSTTAGSCTRTSPSTTCSGRFPSYPPSEDNLP